MDKEKKIMRILKIIIICLLLVILGLMIEMNIQLNEEISKKHEIQTEENAILDETEDAEWIPVADVDITDTRNELLGYLTLPKFKDNYYVDMPIKNGVQINILATAIGHFDSTPLLDGNVCLVAHNSGTNRDGQYVGYFDKLKDLQEGDEIIYNYLSENYTYRVISNTVISQNDLSVLENTNKNLLTLITCLKGAENRQYRRCVVAER